MVAYRGLFGDLTEDKVPLIRIKLAGKTVQALLDPGASGCIIAYDLCNKLQGVTIDPTDRIRVDTAACATSSIGSAPIKVRWAGGYRLQTFMVLEGCRQAVILGRDFLRNPEIVLDVAKGTWSSRKIPGVEVPFDKPMSVMACLVSGMQVWKERVENSACPAASQSQLLDVFKTHANTFQNKPGVALGVKHAIDTGTNAPVRSPVRLMNDAKRAIVEEQLNVWIAEGLIERSKSPWSSPVVIVRKKDGTFRLCGDYRKLNSVTVADQYPMPRIDEILSRLGKAKYFTTLDLYRGYLQVEMAKEDKAKTAFQTPRGLWQFKVMPFGLRNAPATFQRLMDDVLGDAYWKWAMAYLEDIVIYSDSIKDHIKHLGDVLERLAKAGLTVHPDKIQVCVNEFKFLGHVLSPGLLRPDPDKIAAVVDFPTPKNVKQIQQFLGLTGYYRHLTPGFAAVAKPLSKLTSKSCEWTWGPAQELALESLKQLLLGCTGVSLPDLSREFTIQTDASGIGLGAVLLQAVDGVELPIAFASRGLTAAEANYSVPQQECLAVVWAIKKFSQYIEYTHFTIETDHQALKWLRDLKEPAGREQSLLRVKTRPPWSIGFRQGRLLPRMGRTQNTHWMETGRIPRGNSSEPAQTSTPRMMLGWTGEMRNFLELPRDLRSGQPGSSHRSPWLPCI